MNRSMTRRGFTTAALGLAAGTMAPAAGPEREAQKAAEAWLALVDQGNYGASWDEAAAMFKEKVPRAQWVAMAGKARSPLGALASRSLIGARFMRELPQAPDGEYVVIQYSASFAKKAKAVETVTPMKDPDGVWRVSGYYVR